MREGCSLGSCSFRRKFLCWLHLHWSHCWPCLRELQYIAPEVWRWNHPYPVRRVILQEHKCLCHVREWLSCVPGGLLTLAKETGGRVASCEWMKHREYPIRFRAKKCAAGIHMMYWTYFRMPKPIWITADRYKVIKSWKNPYHYDKNILILCVDKHLTATFVQRVLNMYSNSYIGFLVVTSLNICKSLLSGNWKFETLPCQESKEFFLVGIVLKKCFPVWRNLGVTCYLSSLTLTSLLSCWILDTVHLVRIPNNVHSFTWLEMIQDEWDKDFLQHSYQRWKQLWMEGHEQQLLHQRSYNRRVEVDPAALYWQA